ncbi:ubiquinol-cytochrome c reductase iron-sulfur subunit [Thiogranum longum]|uniref:Ubiquinol-cytochrome c reductase iron-sulfur subunit n=1 Tax=Thiogranum longum TaxID=1537524 RepID=A0A4V2PGS8_9GAMM|nr:ubiquinol-cytochrome c reductase iron-sulfur subunit [Thiogranum longum]TCK18026.1 ubiquinol-cytochrome c reductase iron-sulfur subunit [Thiogranum longum]
MTESIDKKRRRLLIAAATVAGGVGVVATVVPFIESWNPSEKARSAGAPVMVDFSKLEPGQQIAVSWRGKPVWVLRRTPKMLKDLRSSTIRDKLRDPDSAVESQQPAYAKNEFRAIKAEYLVVIGICTHLGCVPTFRPDVAPADLGRDWLGGYFCPCHGSRFDLAGRVFKGVPAPTNLVIPPYRFISDTKVLVGEDPV